MLPSIVPYINVKATAKKIKFFVASSAQLSFTGVILLPLALLFFPQADIFWRYKGAKLIFNFTTQKKFCQEYSKLLYLACPLQFRQIGGGRLLAHALI